MNISAVPAIAHLMKPEVKCHDSNQENRLFYTFKFRYSLSILCIFFSSVDCGRIFHWSVSSLNFASCYYLAIFQIDTFLLSLLLSTENFLYFKTQTKHLIFTWHSLLKFGLNFKAAVIIFRNKSPDIRTQLGEFLNVNPLWVDQEPGIYFNVIILVVFCCCWTLWQSFV